MEKNKTQEVRRFLSTPSQLFVRENTEDNNTGKSRIIAGYAVLFNTPSAPLWSDEDGDACEVIAATAITEDFLNRQDIKMTMFHDRQLMLARSKNGEGTLSYKVDEKGVYFEFEAPNTVDGDKALELVRRGDISGCSFAFVTRYYDSDFVERSSVIDENNLNHITYTVKAITGIYDFTLAADPSYPDTSVEARELVSSLRETERPENNEKKEREKQAKVSEQVREMRSAAKYRIL